MKSLLRGIICCGHCDKSMVGTYTKKKNGVVYRYYTCSGAIKNGACSCPVRSVPAGEIEKAVLGQLRVLLRSPEVIAETFRVAQILRREQVQSLETEKSELVMRMVELRALAGEMVSADTDGESGAERFADLKDDIGQTRRRLGEVDDAIDNLDGDFLTEQDVADALRELDPLWDELFPVEQHRVFRALVERVVVSAAGLDIRLRADGIHSIVAEVKGKDAEERTVAA